MPTLNELRGLKSSDRSQQEQQTINQKMGYKQPQPAPIKIKQRSQTIIPQSQPLTNTMAAQNPVNMILKYQNHLQEQYQEALPEFEEQFGVNRNSINGSAEDYINKIASQNSSYYKRYRGTDKLPLTNQDYKNLASQYAARKQTYGEDSANQWLDNQFKNTVGENQSWYEQAINAFGSLLPTIEGGAVQAAGNIWGAINPIISLVDKDLDLPDNSDLNWWDNYVNNILDNPITRLGNDINNANTSYLGKAATHDILGLSDTSASEDIARTKETATKYNPMGIGTQAIVTTEDQDNSLLSSATPWQALQSGGFTALSMIEGAGLAKAGQLLFKGLTNGAKLIKTGRALEKSLENIRKVQNATEPLVISGLVGSGEGAMEGLQTKMQVENEATNNLDNFYRDKVSKEAKELFESPVNNPFIQVRTDRGYQMQKKYVTPEAAFQAVWDKYKDQYNESRRQIDWAASKAGQQNFWANSLINGMINSTLKAGLAAPRVQEALRHNRLTGWAYRNPKFNVNLETNEVTPKMSKLGMVKQVLKEPLGEGMEEYLQSLSNDVFSGAAENNINEFIDNKFNGDGTVKIGDTFGSDWGAALTALKGSLTDTESLQSAILGAVSSTMGTVGGISSGYRRDKNGNLVRNSTFNPRNLLRGYNAQGEKESWAEYARRVTPWRSGLINAYYDRRDEMADANEMAATLTEWLKDPTNRAKWDGLSGTANWLTQMQKASESNDQFSYRKSQMGKAINDVFMLDKLKGTDYYDSVINDLQRASQMDVNSDVAQNMIQQVRANGGEEMQDKSDDEIIEKIQSNANQMLGLMSSVESKGKNLDRMFGRMDEDTKQSLIYGNLMEQNFSERRDQLQEEIDNISRSINSSRGRSNASIDDDLKKLIMRYGSVNKALHAQEKLQEQKEKAEKKVEELSKISKDKLSDKQQKELTQNQQAIKKINKQLQGFDGLYEKDEKGRRTDKIDTSLPSMVLNEEEIMDLDPVTRAMVLAQGADKLYNATHQDRQKVDKLNSEINDLQEQIDALDAQRISWIDQSTGRVKKHHNKQFTKAGAQMAELERQKAKKLRDLNAVQGDMNSKPVYSEAQQAVVDNLIQQGTAIDNDFLDKAVDLGRLEKGIKDYHTQYQAILSNPNVYQQYVTRAKYNAARDLTRRRAERVANIDNFQEYSQEVDKLTANASQQEVNDIYNVLKQKDAEQKERRRQQRQAERLANWNDENDGQLNVDEETGEVTVAEDENYVEPESNFDKYRNNLKAQTDLVRQFAKMPELTDNDQSLLIDTMQYLQSKGVDITSEDAIETLLEKDEEGNWGGKFRQWVEAKNDAVPIEQRAFMPTFTTIGQVVGQYHNLLAGYSSDRINKGNGSPIVVDITDNNEGTTGGGTVESTPSPSPAPTPTPSSTAQSPTDNGEQQQQRKPTIFNKLGNNSPEDGQFVDGDGTVATGTQTAAAKENEQPQEEQPQTDIEKAFWNVTTPRIARMLNIADNFISGSNTSQEAKDLAKQYFMEIAVNGDETFNTLDDVLTTLQEQINGLKTMSNNQEEEKNKFSEAQGILQKIYGSLNAKNIRRERTVKQTPSRPEKPNASWIHTANIAWMQQKNPDAWAVRFYDDHAIDEWNRDNVIGLNESVYFITDSDWTGAVTTQMNDGNDRNYDTLTNMPIVAAIKVDAPTDVNNTTAIEVNGQWYQPIGVMPSSDRNTSGAAYTKFIRHLASKEQGRYLVTTDELPNGNPLVTHVFGKNYRLAHHPDDKNQKRINSKENNKDVFNNLFQFMPSIAEADRVRALPREKMFDDPVYQDARNEFLNGLSWNENTNQPEYTPDRMRDNGTASPIRVFRKAMADTTDRATGKKKLSDVLRDGSNEDVVNFNSRTRRLYDEVIRPLFQYLPLKDRNGDNSAKVITKEDVQSNPEIYKEEAKKLTNILNGNHTRGVSDFIFLNKGWSFLVTVPEGQVAGNDISSSETTFKVFLVNDDTTLEPIELGDIRAGKNDTDAAMQLLKNLLYDGNSVRDFLLWQMPEQEFLNVNNKDRSAASKPRQNIGSMVDDGIFEMSGSSVVYDFDGIALRTPVNKEGKPLYKEPTVANSSNAQAGSVSNETPQAEGGVTLRNGQTIEPDSGANVGDNGNSHSTPPATPPQPQHNKKYEEAKRLTEKIIQDSKEFTLSEDETYYYITDKNTGQRKKYLRVTTIIGADRSLEGKTDNYGKPLLWAPKIEDVINKIKESHTVPELSAKQINSIKDTPSMAKMLGVSEKDVKRAVAELRTEYKHDKYGAWGIPSTAIGNTADAITRDFLAGHVKDSYPNISKKNLNKFVAQLTAFKNDLDSQGIHIVSEGVMAHGTITMTDENGNSHEVNVAGTLDLFGYDDFGNFYIFDMKTTRNHSKQKLEEEKAKWSRQISMYADLLRQSYPEISINNKNLRIIPINVDYPAPMGRGAGMSIGGPQYSITDDGQLQMTYRGKKPVNYIAGEGTDDIALRNCTVKGQFQPGYTSFNINWDNLSSEDQDIAEGLEKEAPQESKPQEAHIETPRPRHPSFIAADGFMNQDNQGTGEEHKDPAKQAPPIVPNGTQGILPQWRHLSAGAKAYLANEEGTRTAEEYADILNDPATAEAIKQKLTCRRLL